MRFAVSGCVANACDLGLYYVLFHVLPVNVSKAVSFICAAAVGYLLSKYWIFQSHKPSYSEIVRYAVVNALALGLNVAVNHCVLHFYPGKVLFAVGTATLSTGLFTYISFKRWVFKNV